MATHRSAVRLSAHLRRAGLGVARASRPWAFSAAVTSLLLLPTHAEPSALADSPTTLPVLDITAYPLDRDDPAFRPFVIARGDHADRSFSTFKDSLALVPGLILQESFGGFEPPRISLRGSGLQSAPSSRGVQLLLNDFPLSLTDGSFNTALIDPQLFERTEVFRGAAAARFAPAALGGALLFRTLSPPRAPGIPSMTSLRAELRSFGGAQLQLASRAMRERTALQAAGSFARFPGFRDHSSQERVAFFGQVSRSVPRGCDTSLSVYHARGRYDVPGPLPLAAASANPRSTSPDVQRDAPRRESALTQVTAQASQQSSVLRLDLGLSWLHNDDWFRQLRPLGISDSQSDDLTFRAVLTRRFEGGNGEHQVRAGTMVSRGWRDIERFVNDSGITGRRFSDTNLFSTTASLDLEATVRLSERLALIAGTTALSTRRDASARASTASPSGSSLHAHTATLQPRAQLLWSPGPTVGWFTAVTRGTEPPTFDDLLVVTGSHPDLRLVLQSLASQRTTTWEIGSSATRGSVSGEVTAYYSEWTREILRLADAQGLPRGAVNAGPTRHVGLEAAGRWRVSAGPHQLDLAAVATWTRFSFADDPIYGRNRLAGTPPFVGALTIDYRHHRGFFAGGTIELTAGATPVDHANRLAYGGYALMHLRAGWRSPPSFVRESGRWTYFVEVKNLLGRDHIASAAGVLDTARAPASTALFLPAPPARSPSASAGVTSPSNLSRNT